MPQSLNVSFATIRRALLISTVLVVAGCGSTEDRAQSYYERGMKLLSQQEYVKAGIEFKNALQLKKDLVGAWRGLAQIEEHNKNLGALTTIRRTIIELDPKDVETRLQLAKVMLIGNRLDDTLNMVNAVSEIEPRNAEAIAIKAAVLLKQNDSSGAIREARTALEIDPNNSQATVVLAAERFARGDADGALKILDRLPADQTSKDIGIQLFKIKIFEQTGDQQQVEAVFRKLIELYPQEAWFRRQLVKYYFDQKRLDDAENEVRAWVDSRPSDSEAGLGYMRFLLAVKGPAATRQELVSRIQAGGQVFPYQMALADLDVSQGNVNESIQLLEKVAASAKSSEETLTAKLKLAEIEVNQKKLDAAEALVAEIMRKDERNTGALKVRAAIRLQRGQLDAAIADLRQALNDQPRSSELMVLLAQAYEQSGSIELAEKQYADATKTSSFDPTVGLSYTAFLQRRGELRRAEDVLTELVNRWPTNVAVLSTLAQVRLSRQDWTGAQQTADTIRRIGNARLADEISGAALSGQNKFDEAAAVLQKAYAAAAPGEPQAMANLVSALTRAGKFDQAVAFLQSVLQSNPDSAQAHVLLGGVQLAKNAPEQAVNSFQTAIERQPKNIDGYRALAELYLRQNNNDEALKVIRAGLEQQPESMVLHLTLAGVLAAKGDYEAAIAEYEDLLKRDPGSMVVANNLASLLSDYRNDKASLDRAYSLVPILRKSQVPSFKDTLGWIHYQKGDYKSAIQLLEEAAAALPDRAMVRYHLGMAYIAAGQPAKASEQLKKALELAPSNDLQAKIRTAQEKSAM
jgi:cellulose synthase operon protein C